jgi:hypothetical protein
MESIKKDINYNKLSKEQMFLIDILLKDKSFKRDMIYETDQDDEIDDVFPFPIFKISELPTGESAELWYTEKKNKLRVPTFVGKLKEIIFDIRPQLILEDLDGKIIKVIIHMDEDFEEMQQRLQELRYTVGNFVMVYDAFRLQMKDGHVCILIESLTSINNERWINRWKPRRGVSAKYIPKIIFALILLGICYYYDLK